jgi:hypothetical protein
MQKSERAQLAMVALAHHFGQFQHPDATADRAHPPARLHRVKLARVADREHLRARARRRLNTAVSRVPAIPASSSTTTHPAGSSIPLPILSTIPASVRDGIRASSVSSLTARPVGATPSTS